MINSQSQLGQENWVLERLNNKQNGYFIDSGAADGIYLSNTLRLEKEFYWDGICVEPLPSFYKTLCQFRDCNKIECGLATEEKTFNLSDIHANSKLDKDGKIEVKCYTIKQVLEKFNAPPIIDYWSLDIEGGEIDILKSFPWDKYHVNCLTVEHNTNVSEQDLPGLSDRIIDRGKIHEFLRSKGYIWSKEVICDDFFIHKDIK